MARDRTRWGLGLLALIGAHAAAVRAGRGYGSTPAERRTTLPGDDLVERPHVVADHAITVDASPEEVWPWLVQMGWHRGGWYTARWVDVLLFPANRPSSDRIVAELQVLDVGDFIPDGPPEAGCGFVVTELEPGHHLVLHSDSHLPLSWRESGLAGVRWSWVFVLTPDARGTRLHFRWRARVFPWWMVAGSWALVLPADLLMSRDMLHGIRARAEGRRH